MPRQQQPARAGAAPARPPPARNAARVPASASAPAPAPASASLLALSLTSFLTHFSTHYTPERWNGTLLPALLQPPRHCALINRWASPAHVRQVLQQTGAEQVPFVNVPCVIPQAVLAVATDNVPSPASTDEPPTVPPSSSSSSSLDDACATTTDGSAGKRDGDGDGDSDDAATSAARRLLAQLHLSTGDVEALDDGSIGSTSADDGLPSSSSSSSPSPSSSALSALQRPAPSPLTRFPPPASRPTGTLYPYYLLDAASVLCARALDAHPSHNVLDMCAAPGGKSLCVLQMMMSTTAATATTATTATTPTATTPSFTGSLTCNELSQTRRERLRRVLQSYVPPAIMQRVHLTSHDATSTAFPNEKFDRVLVDAPCSSDRHVLHSLGELAMWTRSRVKHMAQRQEKLLVAALKACRKGGKVVYATCALSPDENDKVVERVLRKRARLPASSASASASASASSAQRRTNDVAVDDALFVQRLRNRAGIQIVPQSWSAGVTTRFGWMVVPDDARAPGWGPLYFSLLEKVRSEREMFDLDDDDDDGDEDGAASDDA